MRHRSNTSKLKRTAAHRRSLLSNLACSLIEHGRIKTTVAKAKALRPVAEKLVTLARRNDLHARRQAIAFLHQKDIVQKLFSEVAPATGIRPGGFCRITKLGARMTDSAPMAYIEWCDIIGSPITEEAAPAPKEVKAIKSKKSDIVVDAEEVAPVTKIAKNKEASDILGKTVKQDDLQIVEGIGPKIEELLHAGGITTWKQLSESSVETLQAILDAAGSKFAIHNPGTWAEQSVLALNGKWADLKALQDKLDGGKV
jgi:large subunit ribosomal protein L17